MQEKLKEVLSGDFNIRKFVLFAVTALITLIVWNLPSSAFGIEGLTIVQQRVIAIFVMAVLLWLTEAIPAWATSVWTVARLCGYHGMFCRPYNHPVPWWFHPCHCSYEKWIGRAYGKNID